MFRLIRRIEEMRIERGDSGSAAWRDARNAESLAGVKDFVTAHVVTIAAAEAVEDDCGSDGQGSQKQESFVQSVNDGQGLGAGRGREKEGSRQPGDGHAEADGHLLRR